MPTKSAARKIKRTVSHDRVTLTAQFSDGSVTIRWNRYSTSVSGKVQESARGLMKALVDVADVFRGDELVGQRAERFEQAARDTDTLREFIGAL